MQLANKSALVKVMGWSHQAIILTHWGRDKMTNISQMIFSNTFSWNFNSNLTEICSLGSNQQQSSIGSDNGLALIRQQAIIWANDGLAYWCIYRSLGLNELTDDDEDPRQGTTLLLAWWLRASNIFVRATEGILQEVMHISVHTSMSPNLMSCFAIWCQLVTMS